MSGPGATPVVVDTGPLYAHLDADDGNHDRARAVFDAIRTGRAVYRPLYVPSYVVAEFVTLAIQNLGPERASDGVARLRESDLFRIVHPDAEAFEAACAGLDRYDDQVITLVDHMIATIADARNVDHVLTFDSDFRTIGYTRVPGDVDLP